MIDAADFLKWLYIFNVNFGNSNIPIPVPLSYGGTGADLTAANNSLVYSTSSAFALLAPDDNGVLITSNAGVPSWLANSGTPGYVLTANAGAPPSWQNITAEGAVTSVHTDSGNITPSMGVVTITGGSTGLTTSGSSATLTLTGTLNLASGGTNHALTASAGGIVWSDSSKLNILSGTSTAGQLLLSGDAATPTWSTSTYPSTNAVNTLLYASSANVMSALATANNSGLLTNGSGVPSWVTVTGTGAPVLGTSPTISAPLINQINDQTHNLSVATFTNPASAVNYFNFKGSITNNNPSISVLGTDTTIGFNFFTKAEGAFEFYDGNSNLILSVNPVASAVNYLYMYNNATGSSPLIGSDGSDSNIALTFQSKGGIYYFEDNGSAVGAEIRLYNAVANHYTGLKVASAQSSSISFTLPSADGSNGSILQTNGSGVLSFSTTTYPSTNAINTLLYASSANVMSALATANSSVLVTSSGGVPSLSTTLPSGLTIGSPALGSPTITTIMDTTHNLNVLYMPGAASAVNYFTMVNSATGTGVELAASGSDTNIDMKLVPQAAGVVEFGNTGSFSANASTATVLGSVGPSGAHTTVQTWLTIKDNGGNVRYIPCF